jgi:aryl-alcohol dehydrogenase-like predicted oxidoreductase
MAQELEMETRRLGATAIVAARLGWGAARIARLEESNSPGADIDGATQAQTTELANSLLDRGVNFIDTAAGYRNSEEMLGNALSGRRGEYWLATKAPDPAADSGTAWSRDSIARSIDRSLVRLKTDYVDLMQLHGCTAEVIAEGSAIEALLAAKAAGKIRHLGYSGDGRHAMAAIRTGAFDVLQTSLNLVDQRGLETVIPAAHEAGMGIIAKRPIANAAFRAEASPYRYADEYWKRSRALSIPERAPSDPLELSLRFTLSFDQIDVAIVGTRSLRHALTNLRWAEKGGLDEELVRDLRDQFARHGRSWDQR